MFRRITAAFPAARESERAAASSPAACTFKRIAALFLIAAAFLPTVCSCGSESRPEQTLKPITVGSDDYEPYNYIDEDGRFAGVDVELAVEAFHRLGYEPTFRQIVWENKDSYLASGEVGCLWGCFTMTDREDSYTWAGPYMSSTQSVVVRADSDITSLSELDGRCVAVQATSKPEEILLGAFDPRLPEVEKVYALSTMDDVYACLRKGYADAIGGHTYALAAFMSTAPGAYRMLDEVLYVSQLGVAFERGKNTELADSLTEVLNGLEREGITAEISEKYGVYAPEKEAE